MNNLPKEYYIDFDTLKVGDKVYHYLDGDIEVCAIIPEDNFPIKDMIGRSYTREGFYNESHLRPAIYSKNPCELLNNQERVILVKDFEENDIWRQRVLICIKNDKAICWEEGETIEKAKEVYGTYTWNLWKELEEPKELTLEERVKIHEEKIKRLEELLIK
jgi:hypothetical protein